ncbi:MAG: hypothetical protein ACK6C8_02455 [Pseudanabaena sp.]
MLCLEINDIKGYLQTKEEGRAFADLDFSDDLEIVAQMLYPYNFLCNEALHLALLSAMELGRELQKNYEVQPIWTMPDQSGEWNRQTEPTILELIHQTREELLMIIFAVYDIPEIVAAIAYLHCCCMARWRGVRRVRILILIFWWCCAISFYRCQKFGGWQILS